MGMWIFLVAPAISVSIAGTAFLLFKAAAHKQKKRLEVLQAETAPSLRTMTGSRMSEDEASLQEFRISETPHDLIARAKLMGYYGKPVNSDEEQRKYQEHALWVIEHAPRDPLANEVHLLHPKYSVAYESGKRMWQSHLQSSPRDLALILNAANYLVVHDTDLAIDLLSLGRNIESKIPKWSKRLAQAYELRSRHKGWVSKDDSAKALAEQERAYKLASACDKTDELSSLPEIAYNADEFKKANEYSKRLLHAANSLVDDVCNESTISDMRHTSHSILGRIALRNGDSDAAITHLSEAANVKGSPVLCSFGPSMSLAKELLEKGFEQPVLSYLKKCQTFWTNDRGKLNQWRGDIDGGNIPKDWTR